MIFSQILAILFPIRHIETSYPIHHACSLNPRCILLCMPLQPCKTFAWKLITEEKISYLTSELFLAEMSEFWTGIRLFDWSTNSFLYEFGYSYMGI